MTLGERIDERRKAVGIRSQAALARAAGLPQSTLNGLINRPYRWSPHLSRIAAVLQTTVAYLVGETDDPDENAPAPPTAPEVQLVMMPTAWPSELALEQMFAGFLDIAGYLEDAEERPSPAELARELAQQLPIGLSALQGPLVTRRNAAAARPRVLATDDHGPRQ